MLHRLKLFLTFSVLCVTPLLVLGLINFRIGLTNADVLVRKNLDNELADAAWGFQTLIREREHEMRALATGPVRSYVRLVKSPQEAPRGFRAISRSAAEPERVMNAEVETPDGVWNLLFAQGYYADIAGFAADKQQLFVAEPAATELLGFRFRTKDFVPGLVQADEHVWQAPREAILCSMASLPPSGEVLRCSTLVDRVEGYSYQGGALVADLRVESLAAEVVRMRESSAAGTGPGSRITVVLSSSGNIVYHTNAAYRQRAVGSALPSFAPAALSMKSGQTGSSFYFSGEGDQWIESHVPLKAQGLSLSLARNYTAATLPARRAGWLGIALSLLFGLAAATMLMFLYQRKPQSLERVTQSVAAIAGGELNHQLLLRSSDDLRPIADSVNALTRQLREQIAREAEAHQFESFIKLSALLTHDLKNAIGALSLIVDNMERHFDKPQFRTDTLRNLAGATDKLRALVARLSNPVNTMSGEFKRPRPTDLIPLLKRALRQHAEPLKRAIDIEAELPDSLFALVDGERLEKVMENLILNAIEALPDKPGKLTVAAGAAAAGKVFFSVTDTGVGMSPEFIKQRLFRPFATTKSSGVGLGLYTCREVIRANGGSIEVDSTEGSGTTFRVVLASGD